MSAGQGSAQIETPFAMELNFLSAKARGRYDASKQVVEVSDLTVDLGKNGKLNVPAPVDHVFPVRKINAVGTYDGQTAKIYVDGKLDIERKYKKPAPMKLNQVDIEQPERLKKGIA